MSDPFALANSTTSSCESLTIARKEWKFLRRLDSAWVHLSHSCSTDSRNSTLTPTHCCILCHVCCACITSLASLLLILFDSSNSMFLSAHTSFHSPPSSADRHDDTHTRMQDRDQRRSVVPSSVSTLDVLSLSPPSPLPTPSPPLSRCCCRSACRWSRDQCRSPSPSSLLHRLSSDSSLGFSSRSNRSEVRCVSAGRTIRHGHTDDAAY